MIIQTLCPRDQMSQLLILDTRQSIFERSYSKNSLKDFLKIATVINSNSDIIMM